MAETYDYNLLLCKIKKELPQNNTDGSASYQIVVNKYDKSGNRYLVQKMNDKIVEHKQYIAEYGEDLPEIRDWKWSE